MQRVFDLTMDKPKAMEEKPKAPEHVQEQLLDYRDQFILLVSFLNRLFLIAMILIVINYALMAIVVSKTQWVGFENLRSTDLYLVLWNSSLLILSVLVSRRECWKLTTVVVVVLLLEFYFTQFLFRLQWHRSAFGIGAMAYLTNLGVLFGLVLSAALAAIRSLEYFPKHKPTSKVASLLRLYPKALTSTIALLTRALILVAAIGLLLIALFFVSELAAITCQQFAFCYQKIHLGLNSRTFNLYQLEMAVGLIATIVMFKYCRHVSVLILVHLLSILGTVLIWVRYAEHMILILIPILILESILIVFKYQKRYSDYDALKLPNQIKQIYLM